MKNYLKYAALGTWVLVFSINIKVLAGDHEHHDSNKLEQSLNLNNGKKWSTDKALRTNMSEIHKDLKKILEKTKSNKVAISDYQLFGKNLNDNINNIFKNCKLEPKADAQLHVIMAELLKASKELTSTSMIAKKKEAAHDILSNYKKYLKYFDSEEGH